MSDLAVGEFRKLAEGIYLEGLSYDFAREVCWYSDVIKGGIHGVKADGTPVGSFNESRMWTGGVMMNADGAVLSSGERGIMWNHPDTGRSGWLIDAIGGVPINGVNEMWPDGTGGIFFGTIDIENVIAAKDTRPTKIYRLTQDRQVIEAADGVNFANGIGYDPIASRFYCSDTFNVAWTWDVNPDLSLTNRRVFMEREDCDGLAIDSEGNVWITGFRSPGKIARLTPDGAVLEPVDTPPGCTTQIRFGGADLCDFYITIVPADGGDSLKDGKPLSGASWLYRGRSAVPGVAVAPAAFALG